MLKMKNPFLESPNPAKIISQFTAYDVSWKCQKGHINFQTILSLGSQNDICLTCGKHYSYNVEDVVETGAHANIK